MDCDSFTATLCESPDDKVSVNDEVVLELTPVVAEAEMVVDTLEFTPTVAPLPAKPAVTEEDTPTEVPTEVPSVALTLAPKVSDEPTAVLVLEDIVSVNDEPVVVLIDELSLMLNCSFVVKESLVELPSVTFVESDDVVESDVEVPSLSVCEVFPEKLIARLVPFVLAIARFTPFIVAIEVFVPSDNVRESPSLS